MLAWRHDETEEATMPRVRSEEIKVIGKSGQISLGKSYAGKSLLTAPRPRFGLLALTAASIMKHPGTIQCFSSGP
jgi:hypothetical protein